MHSAFTNPITPRVVDVFYMSPPAPGIFINTEVVRTYDCDPDPENPNGRCGDSLTVTIPAGRFFAGSQIEADNAAAALAEAQGAAWQADCGYKNAELTAEYTCPDDWEGGPFTVVIPAGDHCGETQEEADALAQADADAQGAALVATCTEPEPPDPVPVLLMDVRNITQYSFLGEIARAGDNAWVGYAYPETASPTFINYRLRVQDSTLPSTGWLEYNGSGNPRKTNSWTQIFSGYPASPLEAEFPKNLLWSFKAGGSPTAPTAGTGPMVVENSTVAGQVGVVQSECFESTNYNFTLRLKNNGTGTLNIGTPTFTQPGTENTWATWSLPGFTSIPPLGPGDYYDLVVRGNMSAPPDNFFIDSIATLTIPTDIDGSTDYKVGFGLRFSLDD